MKPVLIFAAMSLFLAAGASAQDAISGKAAETMDSGGYTYVRVEQGGKSTWVAVTQRAVKVGESVSYSGGMVMHDFKSKTLGRTFKEIVFSDGPAAEAAAKPAPHSGAVKVAKEVSVATAKAQGEGAYTVAEVFAKRGELAGKPAAVRGKVVKVSLEIMGRNWVHLQDGSGDAKAGTHDLLVTTTETPKVGDTMTARGTVAKDKDFGAGYKYAALIEKGVLTR